MTPIVPQAGGVAIVRVSGDDAVSVARRMFRPGAPAQQSTARGVWAAESHRVQYGGVYDEAGRLVDEARRCEPG